MRTLLAVLLLASAVLGQTPAQTPPKAAPEQGPPPKNLTQRTDGHFSANQDPVNPDKFEVHVVQAGETLSVIAGQVLKNPQLWPQLWEQNEHIVNPHWIYPNDKILIRAVIQITEAAPPEPAAPPAPPEPPPAPEPAPPAPAPRTAKPTPLPPPAPAAAQPAASRSGVFDLGRQRIVPEVKADDLYCSGFVRRAPIPQDLKVMAKFDSSGGVTASETDYVYLSQGAEDGIAVGNAYQVIRATTRMTDPGARTNDERNLGMHYLEIAQLRVIQAQPDFSMARVIRSCQDAVQVGDIMLPFQPVVLPPISRPRPFSPTMTVTGDVKASVVSTLNALVNFGSGSALDSTNRIPGVAGGRLGSLERGVASQGHILYLNAGDLSGVKPGDVFVVFRNVELDTRLYDLPKEAAKLKGIRTAIGELIVLKVGERASTALVTYASDGIALGDAVERR